MGLVVAAAALAIVFNVDQDLQTRLGSYSTLLQKHIEETSYARTRLADLRGGRARLRPRAETAAGALPDYGTAPELRGIERWLNTPGDRPFSIAGLRGKVVLLDFWTYSCINCIRTLPHLRALYSAYHTRGLEIVGVHTPEFAFEHVLSNVRRATHDLNVTWPVALDNSYGTWNAYSNQYWPAEYLIDRAGHVRHVQFGEGDYDKTEQLVRLLLGSASKPAASVVDTTPTERVTPESYLGFGRLDRSRYRGDMLRPRVKSQYTFPNELPRDYTSYAGEWTIGDESAAAGSAARLRLHFHARSVYVVLGGHGRVRALLDGRPVGVLRVDSNRLYTVVEGKQPRDALLELRFSPGVDAYSFTFGYGADRPLLRAEPPSFLDEAVRSPTGRPRRGEAVRRARGARPCARLSALEEQGQLTTIGIALTLTSPERWAARTAAAERRTRGVSFAFQVTMRTAHSGV